MARRRAYRQALAETDSGWLQELTPSFLGCRDMGHAWRPLTVSFDRRANQYVRTLRCTRCRTERDQRLSVSGIVESNVYDYPEGYARPHGSGYYDSAARAAVRLIDLNQQLERAQETA